MQTDGYFDYLDKLYNKILDGYIVTINGKRRKLHDVDTIFKAMYGLYGRGERLTQVAVKHTYQCSN